MSYVDGYVIPLPVEAREKYRALAEYMAVIFKEFGALQVVECIGDDVPHGKVTDFYRAVQAGDGETIVFSWVIWPSKDVRDTAHAHFATDPRMQTGAIDVPFDGKRMIIGGFEILLEA